MGTSRVTELLDFTGGMNTIRSSHLIDRREAIKLVNVDIRLGSLQSMPNLDHVKELSSGPFFFQLNNDIYDYTSFRNNVLWDNKWYWSDGVNTGKVLDDGTPLPLGITTPSIIATVSAEGVADGVHTGDFKYTYTFYSTETGIESAPAPLTGYITVEDDNIIVSNLESLPSNANSYRIYRIGGYLPYFTLVRKINAVELPYTDSLDDTRIDGRSLTTLHSGPPPAGLDNLLEMNGRFYGTVGNKVYFSALGNPDAWYISNYFTLRDTIVGLAKTPAGVLVLSRFYTSLCYGTQPENFRLKVLSDQLGCIGKESIAYLGDSAIWLSDSSFCMSNGYLVTNITANKIDNLSGLYPTGAIVDNDVYYMSFKPNLFPHVTLYPSTKLFPGSVAGTGGVDQGIIAIDFKRGDGFSYKLIEYDDIRTVGLVDGEVHIGKGSLYKVDAPCNLPMFSTCVDTLDCSPYSLNKLNVNKSQGFTTLYYISPELIDGSRATIKEYDKVRVMFQGTFNIKIIFDNDEVVLEQDIESLDGIDTFTLLGIPNAKNKSYFIKFMIEGIGSIESIQYSWKPREVIN